VIVADTKAHRQRGARSMVCLRFRNWGATSIPPRTPWCAASKCRGAKGNHGLLLDAASHRAFIACEGNDRLIVIDFEFCRNGPALRFTRRLNICAGDLERIRLTNDSSRAVLESADRRPIHKNKTRSNRRPLALAIFCTACIRKNTDTHPSA
jgi:hypothetical protein